MNPPVLTFFNNKGGVGKTSLIYHLAWTLASLKKRVVAIDLDPQANLTAAFLDEESIETLWENKAAGATIFECLKPLTGIGDIHEPLLYTITTHLHLIPGDVRLSRYEDTLSEVWAKSLDTNLYRPLRILSAFWQVMQMAAAKIDADIILADIGPNLGAINRSALIATDYVVIPLGADLFSLQGLKNLGPKLTEWKSAWHKRRNHWYENSESYDYPDFQLPLGKMQPLGYLCQQPSIRLDRPVQAYEKWISRIPETYCESVLQEPCTDTISIEQDPHCLGIIKHYRSLIPMAQEHRKPIFKLTSADGAIGSHATAVKDAEKDFKRLAEKIIGKMEIETINTFFKAEQSF